MGLDIFIYVFALTPTYVLSIIIYRVLVIHRLIEYNLQGSKRSTPAKPRIVVTDDDDDETF